MSVALKKQHVHNVVEVVEADHLAGNEQQGVGSVQFIRLTVWDSFRPANCVVCEVSHGAAAERCNRRYVRIDADEFAQALQRGPLKRMNSCLDFQLGPISDASEDSS